MKSRFILLLKWKVKHLFWGVGGMNFGLHIWIILFANWLYCSKYVIDNAYFLVICLSEYATDKNINFETTVVIFFLVLNMVPSIPVIAWC